MWHYKGLQGHINCFILIRHTRSYIVLFYNDIQGHISSCTTFEYLVRRLCNGKSFGIMWPFNGTCTGIYWILSQVLHVQMVLVLEIYFYCMAEMQLTCLLEYKFKGKYILIVPSWAIICFILNQMKRLKYHVVMTFIIVFYLGHI